MPAIGPWSIAACWGAVASCGGLADVAGAIDPWSIDPWFNGIGGASMGAGAWCSCCPMSMPGMDWALAAIGTVSAVAARRVLINIMYPFCPVRLQPRTREDARGRSRFGAKW